MTFLERDEAHYRRIAETLLRPLETDSEPAAQALSKALKAIVTGSSDLASLPEESLALLSDSLKKKIQSIADFLSAEKGRLESRDYMQIQRIFTGAIEEKAHQPQRDFMAFFSLTDGNIRQIPPARLRYLLTQLDWIIDTADHYPMIERPLFLQIIIRVPLLSTVGFEKAVMNVIHFILKFKDKEALLTQFPSSVLALSPALFEIIATEEFDAALNKVILFYNNKGLEAVMNAYRVSYPQLLNLRETHKEVFEILGAVPEKKDIYSFYKSWMIPFATLTHIKPKYLKFMLNDSQFKVHFDALANLARLDQSAQTLLFEIAEFMDENIGNKEIGPEEKTLVINEIQRKMKEEGYGYEVSDYF